MVFVNEGIYRPGTTEAEGVARIVFYMADGQNSAR